EAGLIVVVSFILPYWGGRMLARDCVEDGGVLEVFVDTPLGEGRRRGPKGLDARAGGGEIRNFTGVDGPDGGALEPEIRLATMSAPPAVLAERIVDELRRRGIIG